MSQGDVSKTLGYDTPQFISNWERAVSYPPIEVLKKLAHMYGVSAQEMYNVVEEAMIERTRLKMTNQFKRSIGLSRKSV